MAIPLHHQVLGSGNALLILHGLFGSGTNWRSVARGLQSCRCVHLVDLRNHGESPHHEGMDYGSLAADVAALMDRLALSRADVIGHSMGGKTAMRLALEHPERISRLMVVDISPAPSGSDHLPVLEAMMQLPLNRFSRRAEADAALADAVPEADLRAFLLQNLKAGRAGLRWRIDLAAIQRAMPQLLASPVNDGAPFAGETLFVRGEKSAYVRDEHMALIRRHFPAARLETIAGAGHWPHAEQPEAFLQMAHRFLGCDE